MRDDIEYFIFEELEKEEAAEKTQRPRRRGSPARAITPKGRDEIHIKQVRDLLRTNPGATLKDAIKYVKIMKVNAARRDIEFTYRLETRQREADASQLTVEEFKFILWFGVAASVIVVIAKFFLASGD